MEALILGVPEDTLVLELNECGVVTESEVDECVATKVDVVTVVTLELAAAVSLPALDVSLVEMLAVGGAEAADTLEVVDFTAETSEIPWVPEPLLEAVAVEVGVGLILMAADCDFGTLPEGVLSKGLAEAHCLTGEAVGFETPWLLELRPLLLGPCAPPVLVLGLLGLNVGSGLR